MILSNVQIINYKQYVDEHDIPIPSAATIGVIGANGVGKTTLFEAIEWCLYNPSSIPVKDVRPRGRSGYTKVVVTLDVPGTNQQFLVERELKRASTNAVIYRVEPDGEETIVVQGTKQVTDHIEKKLIGLGHSAFTATFFTRQKELSFFGDLGATARRREVGKLLGLETIRAAQEIIAKDRTNALNEAKVLRNRYEAESQGRDFLKEITAAEATIAVSRQELVAAHEAVDKAKAELAAADENLTKHQALKDKDNEVGRRLLELKGELGQSTEQRRSIEADLGRLAAREKERGVLLPVAAQAEALAAEAERLDGLRKVAQRKRELEHSLKANGQRRADTITSIQAMVVKLSPPAPLTGWRWANGDHKDPCAACDRLLVTIDGIDISVHERMLDDLQSLKSLGRDYEEASKRLSVYEERRKVLDAELEEHLKDGDPAQHLSETTVRIRELQEHEVNLRAGITHLLSQREQISGLAGKLREQNFGDKCPTCQRPFTGDDIRITLEAFQTQMREMDKELHELNRCLTGHQQELVALQTECTTLEKRAEKLASVRQSIRASGPFIEEQRQTAQKLETRLAMSFRRLGRADLPGESDLAQASNELQTWRRIVDTRATIERSRMSLRTLVTEVSTLDQQVREIGEVHYDEAAHAQLTKDLRESLKAQTAVAQIDRDLSRRPQLEVDLASCKGTIASTSASIVKTEQDRAQIGFDAAALDAAVGAAREARQAENIAIEMRHRVQATLRDAENAHDALIKDQERISLLATDADARQREYDCLDQMYREFTEFERFAAAWYAPRLSEITSELVAEVTDGKYDRVVFDNNFGIDIYDGEEEKFPLETFSGGERDVIALCARIALSRVIGGQGAHPPGFLVLDEVFGSLDRDRRSRLLEMLGAITNSGEHFRQIFMISHVDDVRTAPIFDELWQVIESEEGSSSIHSLAPGADIGEL
jgi:exonuclease SbcC